MMNPVPPPPIQIEFPRADAPPLRLSGSPVEVIVAYTLEEVRPALRAVQAAAKAGYYAVGYVSYEAAPAFDNALQVRPDSRLPLLWFGLLPATATTTPTPAASLPYASGAWEMQTSRADYDAAIDAIHAAIARGDTYQVNYTVRLRASFTGDDFTFLQRLRAAQQPSYNAYLNIGRYRILSVSPELFFHWRGNTLTTKPMKGTVRRGYTYADDTDLANWLLRSEKNQAENVMIVDLLRNDMSRVAEVGSVRVPRLFAIEPYPTVFQMTSTVTATTRPDTTLEDIFTAMFPCGSVTGAPKVSTMRLLHELENAPREVYCGAIGVVCPDGEAIFNVGIRTVWIDHETGSAEYGTGGGITWDSEAAAEYEEVLTKAAVLRETPPVFELLETLRYEQGNYLFLERHLERLRESAAYFGFPYDKGAVWRELASYGATQLAQDNELGWRVRLTLARESAMQVTATPLDSPFAPTPTVSPSGAALPVVALHHKPTSRANRFIYHKTTHRALYEAARADHPDAWDTLLWNEDGELMEFAIGNVVLEIEGQYLTPTIASGLLAGTFRAELLAQGVIQEQVLLVKDIARATRVWCINSVRGWVEVGMG